MCLPRGGEENWRSWNRLAYLDVGVMGLRRDVTNFMFLFPVLFLL